MKVATKPYSGLGRFLERGQGQHVAWEDTANTVDVRPRRVDTLMAANFPQDAVRQRAIDGTTSPSLPGAISPMGWGAQTRNLS